MSDLQIGGVTSIESKDSDSIEHPNDLNILDTSDKENSVPSNLLRFNNLN